MKKKFTLLLIPLLFASCNILKSNKNDIKTGWYQEVEKSSDHPTVENNFNNETYSIKVEPVLNKDDFKSMEAVERKYGEKSQLHLDIFLKKESAKKWADFTELLWKKNKNALFIIDGKVFAKIGAIARIENGYAGIAVPELSIEELNDIIDKIKKEKCRVGKGELHP